MEMLTENAYHLDEYNAFSVGKSTRWHNRTVKTQTSLCQYLRLSLEKKQKLAYSNNQSALVAEARLRKNTS